MHFRHTQSIFLCVEHIGLSQKSPKFAVLLSFFLCHEWHYSTQSHLSIIVIFSWNHLLVYVILHSFRHLFQHSSLLSPWHFFNLTKKFLLFCVFFFIWNDKNIKPNYGLSNYSDLTLKNIIKLTKKSFFLF